VAWQGGHNPVVSAASWSLLWGLLGPPFESTMARGRPCRPWPALPGLASWLLPCALPALPTPRAVCLCPLKESPGLNLLTSGPVVGAERHGTSGRGVGRRETGLGKALPVEQRRRAPSKMARSNHHRG